MENLERFLVIALFIGYTIYNIYSIFKKKNKDNENYDNKYDEYNDYDDDDYYNKEDENINNYQNKKEHNWKSSSNWKKEKNKENSIIYASNKKQNDDPLFPKSFTDISFKRKAIIFIIVAFILIGLLAYYTGTLSDFIYKLFYEFKNLLEHI